MDERLKQRDYLLRIGKAITAQLDVQAVLSLVIEYAVEIVAGNYGLIALREHEDDEIHVVASFNLPQVNWPTFEPLLRVLLSPVSGDESAVVARTAADSLGLPLRQVVALPLLLAEAAIGLIVVFRAALNVAFTPDDRTLLQAFADQAAVAVQNARLYEQAVRESDRLHAIIEEAADGVMILDGRWRITTFNRAMELLTGWPREEAIGRPCAEVVGLQTPQGENLCLVACPLQARADVPHPLAEGWMTTRDGRQRYLQTRYSPTRASDHTFLGAIANVRDITAQKNESDQQLTFVSVISHELKTPVAIIKGYAGTLRRPDANWDRATLADGLQIIEEEADRLNDLVSNLLDVSRLQAGSLPLLIAPFALPPLAERIMHGIAATTGAEFTFELRFAPDFPLVLGDEERLRMVLSNLLTNAVKYSPQGGTIRVGGWSEGSHALVYVADQGIGIAREDQQRIFERFYRVEGKLSRTTQGAGLGLYLAQAILEAHGSRLTVESQPGRGARFIFHLPVEHPQLPEGTATGADAPPGGETGAGAVAE